MHEDNDIEDIVRSSFGHLYKHNDVTFNIERISEQGFTGTETGLIVVGFTFSGIIGGILSSVGDDVWKSLKSFIVQLTKKKRKTSYNEYRISLTLIERCNSCICEFKYSGDLNRTNDFEQFLCETKKSLTELLTSGENSKRLPPDAQVIQFVFDGERMHRVQK